MTTQPLRLIPVDGCQWCGITEQSHPQRWKPPAGWHTWAQPTQQQILERMLARRAARLNAPEPVFHAATGWAPDDTGESADPYCADCKTDGCPRWARIQTRLDQQRWGLPRRVRRRKPGGWGGEPLPF